MTCDARFLRRIAEKVGTPFWLYEASVLRQRIADVKFMTATPGLQARFAMKACPATKVLKEMLRAGIWIDAVSGNEALRALHAGFPKGNQPPKVCFTADVFRDNSLEVVLRNRLLPNIGSPGMLEQLASAGYRGPISIRVNPGFGHGHVNACDTGGPSSKHGVWFEDLLATCRAAERKGMRLVMLHAHIGSGPKFAELHRNLERLSNDFAALLPRLPHVEAVSLGGGIPHNYRERHKQIPLAPLQQLFARSHARITEAVRRPMRLEIEPGRYYVASACALVTQVHDVKSTRANRKGKGHTFAMVDAGFVDLIRPAMYGSYHEIEIVGRQGRREPIALAGPLCESGDVFTRGGGDEQIEPRMLPRPRRGDLVLLRDAGAYGYTMSSNYNSLGRAPQVWVEPNGKAELISRRETLKDVLKAECSRPL